MILLRRLQKQINLFSNALLTSTLFKGLPYQIQNTFVGYEYPTANADSKHLLCNQKESGKLKLLGQLLAFIIILKAIQRID